MSDPGAMGWVRFADGTGEAHPWRDPSRRNRDEAPWIPESTALT
ncbi:hypothetical protein [Klugiella xanthotipulae]|uniref:Uncharacterized protein n=1 Tax=Klugiella xanthotipulae TaxID=244735 RepID=A0A543HH21_9MICO|nr:hypothetical protein [Klugiella xanthotipulae]TQM57634.1 hypothetical protein FB466_2629 [Klugiella xanthotipulae]